MKFYEMVDEACHQFKKEHEKVVETLWTKIRGLEAQLDHAASEYQTLVLKKKEPSVIMLTASESLAAYQGLYENVQEKLKILEQAHEAAKADAQRYKIDSKDKDQAVDSLVKDRRNIYNRYRDAVDKHNALCGCVVQAKMNNPAAALRMATGLNPVAIIPVELP